MGSLPTLADISDVHIIFQRHAEAASEVPPNFDNPPFDSLQDLDNIVQGRTNTVQTGVFLPDGLTETGARSCLTFVDRVPGKLGNVYLLAAPPLTRTVESIQGIRRSLQLVGPFHAPRGGPEFNPKRTGSLETSIYVHPGMMEGSGYIPGTATVRENDPTRRYATFLRLGGGRGKDALKILDEQEVDWSGWRALRTGGNGTVTESVPLRTSPSLQSLSKLREKLGCGFEAGLRKSWLSTKRGEDREWHTDHRRRPSDGTWEFRSPTVLKHLQATVWTFDSRTDPDAVLRELSRTDAGYYTRTLGRYYRHLGDGPSRMYVNPDGSVVDQKAAHFRSIQDAFEEVCEFGGRWWTTLTIFTNWIDIENSQTEEFEPNWD